LDPFGAPYQVIDYSGDIKILARGGDCLEALANASRGLVNQIVSLDQIAELEEVPITVTGEDETGRFIALLNELLYLVYTRHWLPKRVRVLRQCTMKDCTELEATLAGEPFDPARHEIKYDIKAVTYHDFLVRTEGDVTTIEFVCDL